jgi:hypothetical protein
MLMYEVRGRRGELHGVPFSRETMRPCSAVMFTGGLKPIVCPMSTE